MQRFALFLSAAGAVGVVLVLVWLGARSPDREVVARVGDQKLTVAEFQRLAEHAAPRYPFLPESAKVALAEDWLRRALLVASARRNPVVVDSLVRNYRDQTERETLVNALAQQLAPRDVAVSDAEVRRFWESRGQETHIQLVYTLDERMMRAAQAARAQGEPFSSVADRFNIAGMLPPGGDLGFVAPGGLVNPLDRIVQATPVGHTSGPVEAPGEGWFLIHVVARRPRERGSYAAEAPQLRSMLTQRKQRLAATMAFKALHNQYAVRTSDDGISVLFQHVNTPPLIQGFGGQAAPPPPTPEENRTVLGTWDGGPGFTGRYTLADALSDLDAGRGGERPNPSMTPALEQWVAGRIMEQAAYLEAKRRHLNEEPDVAQRIQEAVDNFVLEGALESDIARVSQPTAADLQTAYEQNSGSLAKLQSVTVQYLTLPDSGSAVRAFERVRPHPTLEDAVLLASPGMQVREEVVLFPSKDPLWSVMEGGFRQAPLGTYFPPMRVPQGWRIVQLTGRDMPMPTFNQLPAGVQQNLFQEATTRARRRRLEAYTDSLRRVIPWSLNREALRHARWPLPGMEIGG
jgi:parvulin-like peptidyl-prolyl isomerase